MKFVAAALVAIGVACAITVGAGKANAQGFFFLMKTAIAVAPGEITMDRRVRVRVGRAIPALKKELFVRHAVAPLFYLERAELLPGAGARQGDCHALIGRLVMTQFLVSRRPATCVIVSQCSLHLAERFVGNAY